MSNVALGRIRVRGVLFGKGISLIKGDSKSCEISVAPQTSFGHGSFFFVHNYNMRDDEIKISTPQNNKFRKIYLRKSFPFLQKKRTDESYKSFSFAAFWNKDPHDYQIRVGTGTERHALCLILVANTGDKSVGAELSIDDLIKINEKPQIERIALLRSRIIHLMTSGKLHPRNKRELALIFAAIRSNYNFLKNYVFNIKNFGSNAELQSKIHSEINAILKPLFLGPHNYSKRLSDVSTTTIEICISRLHAAVRHSGHELFINSGTLLGAVRDGNLITHDDDLDVAVYLNGHDIETVAKQWKFLREKLSREFKFVMKGSFCAVFIDDDVQIDIFPAWASDGKMFIYPYCFGDVAYTDIFPLGEARIGDKFFSAPKYPEKLLEINYGLNWRTPDATWRFDWGASHKKFNSTHRLFYMRG